MTGNHIKLKFNVCCDFQPIYSIQNGELTLSGFEALAREIDYSDNSVQLLLPQNLIDELSSQHRLSELDLKSLDDTCRFIAHQKQQHPDWDIPINVNLSAQTLSQKHCVSTVHDILNKYNISTENIGIEIVEDSFDGNEKQILDNIYEFTLIGHPIAIDDFDTGDSDLNRIKKVQQKIFDTEQRLIVKIDRSLTERTVKNGDFNSLNDSAFQNVNLVFEGATSRFFQKLKASKFYEEFKGEIKLQGNELGKPRDHVRTNTTIHSHRGREKQQVLAYA